MADEKRVLFIGNSFTYYNDMPAIFARVCAEHNIALEAESVTAGGYFLEYFLSPEDEFGAEVRKKLAGAPYDFVVMQEQSFRPAGETELFLRDAAALTALVRKNGAIPVFYETWGYRDDLFKPDDPEWDHDKMQARLRDAYERAAAENGAILVRAGELMSREYQAGTDVFDPDGSHPSATGSELIAGEFYRVLFA